MASPHSIMISHSDFEWVKRPFQRNRFLQGATSCCCSCPRPIGLFKSCVIGLINTHSWTGGSSSSFKPVWRLWRLWWWVTAMKRMMTVVSAVMADSATLALSFFCLVNPWPQDSKVTRWLHCHQWCPLNCISITKNVIELRLLYVIIVVSS